MVVKLRFPGGPVVTRRKGKNSRAAMLASSCLTLSSVCIGSLGLWRLGEDLDLAGEFFFREGILSHWQMWLGAAAAIQYGAWRLNRYAKSARERIPPDVAVEEEPQAPRRAAANV